MTAKLLIATANDHKAGELRALLAETLASLVRGELPEILTLRDFDGMEPPEETGRTFDANARLKAEGCARAAGLWTLADDSGLAVDALCGRPGVRSARYAPTDAERIARLLGELEGIPAARRCARFECVMALASPAGECITCAGHVRGRIAIAPRGAGGFGYDPIFELLDPPHAGRMMAELSPAEKNGLSHRGRARRARAPHNARALA